MSYTGSSNFKRQIRHVLYGRTASSTTVNDILLAANFFIIIFALFALAFDFGTTGKYIEFGFGLVFAIEYLVRLWVSRHKFEFVFRLVNVLDIVVIVSLMSSVFVANFAFLRVLRAMQILRAYKIYKGRFSKQNEFIMRQTDVITAFLNLVIFLLVMSAIVYTNQVGINSDIKTYVDAMYFTVSALTTTGFGDITMMGDIGKLLAIIIMLLGVTLFFRLVKSIFVPRQLYSTCPSCGFAKHPLYALYCNRCGHHIKNKFIDGSDHKTDYI